MTGSEHDGEALNAIRLATKTLAGKSLSWDDVIKSAGAARREEPRREEPRRPSGGQRSPRQDYYGFSGAGGGGAADPDTVEAVMAAWRELHRRDFERQHRENERQRERMREERATAIDPDETFPLRERRIPEEAAEVEIWMRLIRAPGSKCGPMYQAKAESIYGDWMRDGVLGRKKTKLLFEQAVWSIGKRSPGSYDPTLLRGA